MDDFAVDDWNIVFVVVRIKDEDIVKWQHGELKRWYGREGCNSFEQGNSILMWREITKSREKCVFDVSFNGRFNAW